MTTQGDDEARMVDFGELSRDFGLDITLSDGGLVTSALNQRQYRVECSKLYQQFKLTMADYIFEETQLKKRLHNLLVQKKQPHIGVNSTASDVEWYTPMGEAWQTGDEDAFTPSQMEEFRQLATSSKGSMWPASKAGIVTTSDQYKAPTSISLRIPSSVGESLEAPHIFPALKERPLTQPQTTKMYRENGPSVGSTGAASAGIKRHSMVPGSMMYGGRDEECDGAMDPTADFSTNRRMRMNPRAFSKLSSAGRMKVTMLDKKGQFVMKPVSGRPGVVSLHGGRNKDDMDLRVRDSKEKLALIKTVTSFDTPTLSSELKTNNLVAIQKSLIGQESRKMSVGDVMSRSRDRRARLFHVQMSTGRLDDWNVPGEHRGRQPTRIASAADGHGIFQRKSPRFDSPRQAKDNEDHEETDSRKTPPEKKSRNTPRAKTAPSSHPRPQHKSPCNTTPRTSGKASISPRQLPQEQSSLPNRESNTTPSSRPKLSVVQLKLAAESPESSHKLLNAAKSDTSGAFNDVDPTADRTYGSRSTRGVFPVSTNNLQNDTAHGAFLKEHTDREKHQPDALELAEQECSVHVKQISSLRESALVVRRWQEQDRDREEKLNKWRMRMSFGATRRGHLVKV